MSGCMPEKLRLLSDRVFIRLRRNTLMRWWNTRRAPAPVRPMILIQSDDWGRAGLPDVSSLCKLREMGYIVGESPWDFYGLETTEDLQALRVTLEAARDQDGTPACIVANFILANPDLRRMVAEGYQQDHWVALRQGLPPPWHEPGLLDTYHVLINAGVFYPALHGFSHFNDAAWKAALNEADGELGRRARALAENDIPYLASLTPEFNFALVARHDGQEIFRSNIEQESWVKEGVRLFIDAFGRVPVSTCAPGYRCNGTTYDQWRAAGLKIVQTARYCLPYVEKGMLVLSRNVFFEPVLDADCTVEKALARAEMVIQAGMPVIISSHSINYMQRHLGRAQYSRDSLSHLLTSLLDHFPNLRFANDENVWQSFVRRDDGWWRTPSRSELRIRGNNVG